MSQKDKLLGRLLALSRNFTYDELETLLGYYMFRPDNKGKTSGSRVLFIREGSTVKITMHKPHPQKELKVYQMKQVISLLEQEGLL